MKLNNAINNYYTKPEASVRYDKAGNPITRFHAKDFNCFDVLTYAGLLPYDDEHNVIFWTCMAIADFMASKTPEFKYDYEAFRDSILDDRSYKMVKAK